MKLIRINQLLAERFGISRRLADQWILSNQVKVNDKIAKLGQKVDEDKDLIFVNNLPIPIKKQVLTFAFHKPKGVVCSLSLRYEKGISIKEYLPPDLGLKPVGRLDIQTEGLIIVTNDGRLHYEVTHPSFEIEKEYIVTTAKPILEKEIFLLSKGVMLSDGFCQPDHIGRIGSNQVKLVLHEGRNREIRRLFSAINHRVERLVRIRIGMVELGNLPVGALRLLTEQEIKQLKFRRKNN
ncbi:MAG: rRNA pseudouridine synthase [bacterium]|nr:rRNA pseudouridine synthase [bacterium]